MRKETFTSFEFLSFYNIYTRKTDKNFKVFIIFLLPFEIIALIVFCVQCLLKKLFKIIYLIIMINNQDLRNTDQLTICDIHFDLVLSSYFIYGIRNIYNYLEPLNFNIGIN